MSRLKFLFEKGDVLNRPIECFYFDTDSLYFPIRPHWHFYMELIYMLEGSVEMTCCGETFTAHPGEMLLFHPKAVHAITACKDCNGTARYAVIKLDISRMSLTPSYAPKLRSIFRSAEKKGMNIFFNAEQTAEICAQGVFTRCIEEMQRQRYGFDLMITSELYGLLIRVLRCWQSQGFSVDSEAYSEDAHYDIYNITEFIDERLSSGVQVTEVAQRCGMSYSYFAKKFLAVYGKTCKEYIEEMRIIKAEEFLTFTDFDLNRISRETGFSDCSHMIRSFKKLRGVTPKQFRSRRTGAVGRTD
ncbi:MAG: helix-turn-helix domain-containing protein [Oscillospiraceae bacterium]